jgi:hypothetical protein
MIKTEFEFGEKILVSGMIYRTNKPGNIRCWVQQSFDKPRPAIFLNGIHLANGISEWEDYGEGEGERVFNTTELIKGAWICEYNRAPRKVFLSDCHKINRCIHVCPEHNVG